MIKMMNKIEQLKLSEDGFTLIEMMIVVAIIAILTAIAMYKVQNNRAPQDISDLDEYIDVENIKAPTGDVYVNGVLTSNETGENYSLNSDKTNATFMGKTRMEFGKNTSE